MNTDDKYKILDIRMPKDEQEKSEELQETLAKKQYQVKFRQKDGKERFAYTNDHIAVEFYLKATGSKILEVTKL